ncbi:MAG: pyridoxal-phosphate dependent enzyme, partial [Candidatus Aenigmarchaeota archaeon]|nr:pyridoxal-phosphate dependent enzyme [Candidatus Aenigmarchaeota archaeon]
MIKLVRLLDRLDMAEVPAAALYMERHLDRTPVILYDIIRPDDLEIELWGKMDTLNPGGSFKDRGAEYFMKKRMESGELQYGDTVVTAS